MVKTQFHSFPCRYCITKQPFIKLSKLNFIVVHFSCLFMYKKISTITIVILIIFLGIYGIYANLSRPQINGPLPTPSDNAGDAQAIDDVDLGFTIKLPPDFSVEQNGQFSRLITKKTSESPVGTSSFIYISVVPLVQETEEGEVYNYSKNDYEKLLKTQVGDQVVLGNSPDANLNSYFTYTREEGAMVGGYGANVYINTKPWEFPAGTVEYRYIIPFSAASYIIGGYISPENNTGGVTKAEFDQIITSLQLKPDDIRLVKITPVAEGEWKTFNDSSSGLSFEYPSNWKKLTTSQFFENGDIFAIQAIGQTQRPQTELYDGANFAVMRPVVTDMETLEWMKSRYSQGEPVDASRPPVYESVSFGGMRYEKVTVCGLGCFPYYHIKKNGKVYGFLGFTAGPNETEYQGVIDRILSSVTYSK